jgi:hypothetical protein
MHLKMRGCDEYEQYIKPHLLVENGVFVGQSIFPSSMVIRDGT